MVLVLSLCVAGDAIEARRCPRPNLHIFVSGFGSSSGKFRRNLGHHSGLEMPRWPKRLRTREERVMPQIAQPAKERHGILATSAGSKPVPAASRREVLSSMVRGLQLVHPAPPTRPELRMLPELLGHLIHPTRRFSQVAVARISRTDDGAFFVGLPLRAVPNRWRRHQHDDECLRSGAFGPPYWRPNRSSRMTIGDRMPLWASKFLIRRGPAASTGRLTEWGRGRARGGRAAPAVIEASKSFDIAAFRKVYAAS